MRLIAGDPARWTAGDRVHEDKQVNTYAAQISIQVMVVCIQRTAILRHTRIKSMNYVLQMRQSNVIGMRRNMCYYRRRSGRGSPKPEYLCIIIDVNVLEEGAQVGGTSMSAPTKFAEYFCTIFLRMSGA